MEAPAWYYALLTGLAGCLGWGIRGVFGHQMGAMIPGAMMGAALSEGENRAIEAAQQAISSPLLEDISIQGARGVLINITGGPALSLYEVNEASSTICESAHQDANIIFGTVPDESISNAMKITVIATGFGEDAAETAAADRGPMSRIISSGATAPWSWCCRGDTSGPTRPSPWAAARASARSSSTSAPAAR